MITTNMPSVSCTRQALAMHQLGPHTAHRAQYTPMPRFVQPALCPTTRQRAHVHTSHIARAKTASMDLEIGMTAPPFSLLEPLTGKTVSLSDFEGAPALLFIIMCNHCPFVKMLKRACTPNSPRDTPPSSQRRLSTWQPSTKPRASPSSPFPATRCRPTPRTGQRRWQRTHENLVRRYCQLEYCASTATLSATTGYPFPYLYDKTQAVAQAYSAACTPEFYVFDGQQRLRYHGQFDDARPTNGVVPSGRDVRAALDAVLAGNEVPGGAPSLGCNIKWHPGNEPSYFGQTAV